MWLVAFMVFIMCGILAYQKTNLEVVSKNAQGKITELNKKIAAQEERAEEIKDKKAYVQTNKYIEQMAREKLGLVYEDEIIFKSDQNR